MLILLMSAVGITILFLHPGQTSWAALILCPPTTAVCNGTTGDDVIYGAWGAAVIIHGLGGNDYILSFGFYNDSSYLYGDDGNDILIGGLGNDGLYGGNGDDKYDGFDGSDTIWEVARTDTSDVISGGPGDDYIEAAGGTDTINGGPGNDRIFPNYRYRDFLYDSVDCGSGVDTVYYFYSGDRETASYCENINNYDG